MAVVLRNGRGTNEGSPRGVIHVGRHVRTALKERSGDGCGGDVYFEIDTDS